MKDFNFFSLTIAFWTSLKVYQSKLDPFLPDDAKWNAFSTTYLTSVGFLIISAYFVSGFTIGKIFISAVPKTSYFFDLVLWGCLFIINLTWKNYYRRRSSQMLLHANPGNALVAPGPAVTQQTPILFFILCDKH